MATLSVSYSRNGDVHKIETGNAALGTLVIDNTGIPADARGGTAKQLLASSALFCYCSALVSALDARGVKYGELKATATLETGNNNDGQGRVKSIHIDVAVPLSEEDASTFERVEKIMKQGCLVTGSLHEGIHMTYALSPEYDED